MPKPASFALIITTALTLASCATYRQQAFYVSPFNGSSESYHTLPMHTDTVTTAVYGRIAGFGGSANNLNNDHYGGGNASIYIAHHGSWWQAYCGVDGTLGGYTVDKWETRYSKYTFNPFLFFSLVNDDATYYAPTHAQQLNTYSGAYSYGGLGFSGGFNAVIPMGQGEWRFLGIETALHQEYGQYRDWRGKLPDSIASYIVRNPFYASLGLTTEFIFRTRTGDFGFRLADGWVLGPDYHPSNVYDSIAQHPLRYSYGTFTAHMTMGRYTIYYQGEGGTRANSYQLGLVYRFGDPRLPAKKRIYRERPPLPEHPPHPRLPFGLGG